jgi:uncharacterized protein YndB with AHSA1/START domain
MFTGAMIAAILVAAVLGYAATRPDAFRVARSQRVQAPPERIFELINDFHQWAVWSPWEKLDPAMTKSYTGAASGKGAVYAWAGNRKAGEGRMEITDTVPGSRVVIKLDFLKPFEGHNTAEFGLEVEDKFTNVTWTMSGPVPYPMKLTTMFFSMDGLVGKDFETGLTNMKAIAEN